MSNLSLCRTFRTRRPIPYTPLIFSIPFSTWLPSPPAPPHFPPSRVSPIVAYCLVGSYVKNKGNSITTDFTLSPISLLPHPANKNWQYHTRAHVELCMGKRTVTIGLVAEDGEANGMKIEDLVRCLEDEKQKIEMFKRELPLCLGFIKHVIDVLNDDLMQRGAQSSNARPILEQFLPIKGRFEDDKEMVAEKDCKDNKMNWMTSAQLWKNDDDDTSKQCGGKSDVSEKVGKHLLPDLSLLTPGIVRDDNKCFFSATTPSRKQPLASLFPSPETPTKYHNIQHTYQQNCSRKARRCWSLELHQKFVNALEQLGGSHVATPKQIREMMQVDGLTNDEVKSHLQKYRLHNQRVHSTSSSGNNETEHYDDKTSNCNPSFSTHFPSERKIIN